jgi:hypothetical protein
MYGGGEWLHKHFVKKNSNTKKLIENVFWSHHVMRKLQIVVKKGLKSYMLMWHASPCHITLGPHKIYVKVLRLKLI